jgi:hypothetical protein
MKRCRYGEIEAKDNDDYEKDYSRCPIFCDSGDSWEGTNQSPARAKKPIIRMASNGVRLESEVPQSCCGKDA